MSSMSVLGVLVRRIHTCRGIWMARSSFTRSIRPGRLLPARQHRRPEVAGQVPELASASVPPAPPWPAPRSVPTKKLVLSSRRLPLSSGLSSGAAQLHPPRGRGLELVRVDQPEVLQRGRRAPAPGSLSGRRRTVPLALSSCLLAGEQLQPLDPERVALEPSVQRRHARRPRRWPAASSAAAGEADGAGGPRPSGWCRRSGRRPAAARASPVAASGRQQGLEAAPGRSCRRAPRARPCRTPVGSLPTAAEVSLRRERESVGQGAFDRERAAARRRRRGGDPQTAPVQSRSVADACRARGRPRRRSRGPSCPAGAAPRPAR